MPGAVSACWSSAADAAAVTGSGIMTAAATHRRVLSLACWAEFETENTWRHRMSDCCLQTRMSRQHIILYQSSIYRSQKKYWVPGLLQMTMINGILKMSVNQCTALALHHAMHKRSHRHNGILKSYEADSEEPLQWQ